MSPLLDGLLCKRYPEIFKMRHAPMTETAMCWGFECGDGWFELIDCLCASIMDNPPPPVAVQVKEKFGGLRFYVDSASETVWGLIEMAEAFSFRVCEICGALGKRTDGHYIRVRCPIHWGK